MTAPDLEFRRYGAEDARAARDTVAEIYRDAYAEVIASGEPFDSTEAFMDRFESYTGGGRGFDLVIAFAGVEPAGQAFGWPLGPGTGWWAGMDREPEPGFTDEDGERTFAFSEIMVCHEYAGRGVAHALHDELLRGRYEKRATLLVEPENETAYRAYLRWGWRTVGQLRPAWEGAPLFDVLIRPLPLRSPGAG